MRREVVNCKVPFWWAFGKSKSEVGYWIGPGAEWAKESLDGQL